jgi:hypothetical protein
MAKAGGTQRIHPSKRHRDPLKTKTGKTRLGPLNTKQLQELAEKAKRGKDRAKFLKEIFRKQALLAKRSKK